MALATANQHDLARHAGYCVAFFGEVTDVEDWIDDQQGQTAICPYCGIDAVVPVNHIPDDGSAQRRLQILRRWRQWGFGNLARDHARAAQHHWMPAGSPRSEGGAGGGEDGGARARRDVLRSGRP